ncbi:hypothetical protein EKO04_005842 [Ascochyta lentis]|uniref:2',3'-cyclic-nucleotide 3'-phosphodiesterase n=1 Tax=Ascochyta lentis TaxID=205686 RepID=A0A8H7J3C8_9PLEO|nr:hypothetical protein EKO04_005842 [Ascochyta lentis]
MPGSSLWLLPPETHPLNDVLTSLIKRTAARFGSSSLFVPHVTLTSNILPSTYESEPQKWLESLPLPEGHDVRVDFEELNSEDVYVRKLYIKCQKTGGLKALAKVCRKQAVDHGDEETVMKWVDETYNPHASLLYHDCPQINAKGLEETRELARKEGIDLAERSGGLSWSGGRVVLVATDKPIAEWKPIAERVL